MTIDDYLRELSRQLRVGRLAKRRILREVEAHLRDAASREGDASRAVARFGSPEALAVRFTDRYSTRLRASVLVGAAALLAGSIAATLVLTLGKSGPSAPAALVRAAEHACDGRADCVDILTRRLVARAKHFVRAVCGGENAKPQCLRAAKATARDAVAYVPCSEIPGMVQVGGSTWRLQDKKDGVIFSVCSEASSGGD